MYSPLGLVIFLAVERTFVCFTKSHEHFISNSIRCGCLRTDQCNIACSKAAINRNALAIDPRPPPPPPPPRGGDELCRVISAVRVCRCRCMILCIQRSGTICRTPGVVFIRFSGPRFPVLVGIRLVTVNRHARCSL